MKKLILFSFGVCAGAGMVMLYLHRELVMALINGEELPEAPEGCPAFKGPDDKEDKEAEDKEVKEEGPENE